MLLLSSSSHILHMWYFGKNQHHIFFRSQSEAATLTKFRWRSGNEQTFWKGLISPIQSELPEAAIFIVYFTTYG